MHICVHACMSMHACMIAHIVTAATRASFHRRKLCQVRQPFFFRNSLGPGPGLGSIFHHKPRIPKPHNALHPPHTPTKPPNQTKNSNHSTNHKPHVALHARFMRHKCDRKPPNQTKSQTISHQKPNHKTHVALCAPQTRQKPKPNENQKC